jgi:hypothetical protein
MGYRLSSISFLRLRFDLGAQKEANLPAFKGSLLRGAFGHALRRTVCVMGPQQPCPTCMLRKQCAYPRIFETLIEPDEKVPRFLRGLPTGPQPYVFEPFDEQRLYRAGESLSFDFILLGQAILKTASSIPERNRYIVILVVRGDQVEFAIAVHITHSEAVCVKMLTILHYYG